MSPIRTHNQTPEDLARELVQAICRAFSSLKEEQNTLFLEMGYTAQERIALSVTLAQTLYQSGIAGYPKKKLHALISEGELQAMLYLMVCGTTPEGMETQYVRKLIQRPDIYYHERAAEERVFRGETDREGDDDVPSVLSRDRAARRGAQSRRTGRDPRRTGRRHDDLSL